jgi:hypothetical protein
MSGTRSNAEFTGQHPELLPARTVLSTFLRADGAASGDGTNPVSGLLPHVALLDKLIPGLASQPVNGSPGLSGTSSSGIRGNSGL